MELSSRFQWVRLPHANQRCQGQGWLQWGSTPQQAAKDASETCFDVDHDIQDERMEPKKLLHHEVI